MTFDCESDLTVNTALQAERVDFSYYDGLVLRELSLTLAEGELVGLLGPNGSGKTTLLNVLSGLLAPKRGQVLLWGEDVQRMDRRQIARRLAVVPQELEMPFGFSAYEMVMLGRTPHVRPLVGVQRRDRDMVLEKMRLTNTQEIAERPFSDLSGGERQRVILAMALAQESEILLLDEPVVHLDISHQIEIMEMIKDLNQRHNLTVLASMHDLNLAALYFDRLVLLDRGSVVSQGKPDQVLNEETLRRVFGAAVKVQRHPTRSTPNVVLLPPSG
jgi:iron complex transport system ATP-binding protein